jgi:hypothetical protein
MAAVVCRLLNEFPRMTPTLRVAIPSEVIVMITVAIKISISVFLQSSIINHISSTYLNTARNGNRDIFSAR